MNGFTALKSYELSIILEQDERVSPVIDLMVVCKTRKLFIGVAQKELSPLRSRVLGLPAMLARAAILFY